MTLTNVGSHYDEADPVLRTRLRLVDNGYRIVECSGKRPFIDGWQTTTATAGTVSLWKASTNTGLILGPQVDGSHLIAVDIDIYDPTDAIEVDAMVQDILGPTPLLRIGQEPKRLLVYRTDQALRKVTIPAGMASTGEAQKIEILAEGQQFIGFGIHPDTRQPFRWPTGESPETMELERVPLATGAKIAALAEWLRGHFGDAHGARPNGSGTTVSGQIVRTRGLVAVPLTDDELVEESRAAHGWHAAVLTLVGRWVAQGWSDEQIAGQAERVRWPDYSLEQTQREMLRMAAGARRKGWAPEGQGSPPEASNAEPAEDWLSRYDSARWAGKQAPEIEFTIEGMMPQGVAVLLAGDGGSGKSILGQLMATCLATGKPFLGRETKTGAALYLTAEDSEAIAWHRQARINETLGVTMEGLAGRLFVASMSDDGFVMFSAGKPTDAETRLDNALAAHPEIRIAILDSGSLVFDDDEIKRQAVAHFMRRLNRLADKHGITIVLIVHTSKSSDGSVAKLASGSTSWVYGSRGGFLLTKTDDGFLKFSLVKAQYTATFEIELVLNDKHVPVLAESMSGYVASIQRSTDDKRVKDAIAKAWSDKNPLTAATQSQRYLPNVMARQGMPKKAALAAMTRLSDAGEIVSRRPRGSTSAGWCPKELTNEK